MYIAAIALSKVKFKNFVRSSNRINAKKLEIASSSHSFLERSSDSRRQRSNARMQPVAVANTARCQCGCIDDRMALEVGQIHIKLGIECRRRATIEVASKSSNGKHSRCRSLPNSSQNDFSQSIFS